MSSYQLTTDFTGEIGVIPRLVRLRTTDILDTIMTAGYLPNFSLEPTDVVFCSYAGNNISILQPSIDVHGVITLELTSAGAINSVFGRTGAIVATDGDYTQNLITGLKTTDSPSFVGLELTGADLLVDNGNITTTLGGFISGSSAGGDTGSIQLYSSTANKGSLQIFTNDNAANYIVNISNASMGQACDLTIPDPGASTANFMLNTGTATMASGSKIILAKNTGTESSNAVTVNEQSGVITTSALTTAAGSSYSITFTNSKIATSSVVMLSWMGGTNTTKTVSLSATAGNGTSTISINNIGPTTALNGTLIIGFAVF